MVAIKQAYDVTAEMGRLYAEAVHRVALLFIERGMTAEEALDVVLTKPTRQRIEELVASLAACGEVLA